MEKFDWREAIRQLREDTTSGSQAVCLKAAEIIVKTVDSLPGESPAGYTISLVEELYRNLPKVKPAMAGLYNLSAEITHALESAREQKKDIINPVRRAAVEFRSRLLSSNSVIASKALDLIPANACVAVYSHSATVEAVVKLAAEKGKVKRVLISEARPAYEGRISAAEFAGANIQVVFVADATLPGILGQCHIVIAGGDALCPAGLVNKAGTYAIALTARMLGKPFVACIGLEKIIPFDIPEHYLREDPENLWPGAPQTVQVVNKVFEYTPMELLDHLVTEEGITSDQKIPEIFASSKIHPYLPDWL